MKAMYVHCMLLEELQFLIKFFFDQSAISYQSNISRIVKKIDLEMLKKKRGSSGGHFTILKPH